MSISVAVLFLFLPSANAAIVGPDSQTLEALRGSAVSNPDRFFDGMDSRVKTLTPVDYQPLPVLPRPTPSNDVTFDSRRVLPDVTIHAPKPAAEPSPVSRGTRVAGGAAAAAGAGALAAGLIAGGSLLLPLAGVGVALLAVGLYLLLKKR